MLQVFERGLLRYQSLMKPTLLSEFTRSSKFVLRQHLYHSLQLAHGLHFHPLTQLFLLNQFNLTR
jgi:hypothetical protein